MMRTHNILAHVLLKDLETYGDMETSFHLDSVEGQERKTY